jgi:subtilase family serine protease
VWASLVTRRSRLGFSVPRNLGRVAILAVALMLACWVYAGRASAAATPCADLQIPDVTFSPGEPVMGQPATVEVTVSNAGTCDAGGFLVQFSTSKTGPVVASDSINSLAAGASTTLDLPYTFPTAGNFETVIQVNASRAVAETNYTNDLAIAPVTVAPAGVSLVINQFSIANGPTGHVVVGEAVTATFAITNSGNAPAGPFDVQWTPYALATPLTAPVSGLAPGASTTVTITFTFPFTGTVTGRAVLIDSASHLAESAISTLKTEVQPDLPNLAIAPSGIQVNPAPAGSPSTLSVTVTNNGNAPAGDFLVTWKPSPLARVQSQQVNGLDVGESQTLTFSYQFLAAGTYHGTVTLDSSHVVKEVSESDNTAPTTFKIPAATVDLAVTDLTINPSSPTQGAAATVTVTVQNLGNSPSGTFMTSWNPDTLGLIVPSVHTLLRQVSSLGPGASTDVVFSFTYPQPGNFRTLADVKTLGSVHDANTSNNQRILNVTVVPAQIDLVFTQPTITFNPASPVRGVQATASVGVVNDGPIATGSFAVKLVQQSGGAARYQFINGLNVGESRTLTFNVDYFATGTFTATATIDPFNQVVRTSAAQAADVITQSVTVVPPTATVQVTLSQLSVISAGTSSWDPILLGVYDPASTCSLSLAGKTVNIPKIDCVTTTASGVSDGGTISPNLSVDVTLNNGAPLVGVAAAADQESVCVLTIIVCVKSVDIPVIRGFAPMLAFAPKYAAPTAAVKGLECLLDDYKTPDNGGHCFDASFGTSIQSANYPLMAQDLARTRTAKASAARASAAGAKSAATMRVVAKERAYVKSALAAGERKLGRLIRLHAARVARERQRHINVT